MSVALALGTGHWLERQPCHGINELYVFRRLTTYRKHTAAVITLATVYRLLHNPAGNCSTQFCLVDFRKRCSAIQTQRKSVSATEFLCQLTGGLPSKCHEARGRPALGRTMLLPGLRRGHAYFCVDPLHIGDTTHLVQFLVCPLGCAQRVLGQEVPPGGGLVFRDPHDNDVM